jgi:DNA-binding XRE family transcriptional regulator
VCSATDAKSDIPGLQKNGSERPALISLPTVGLARVDNTLPKEIGQFVAALDSLRAQRRMTQEQFAEALEISVDFLSLIERGASALSFETLERMAKRLRLSVAELFTFD